LLANIPSTVALTITTEDDTLAKIIEPYAPPPFQRLRAAQDLIKAGIPVSVRIDPIIFSVNDLPLKLISELASIGVKHITASTYKAKADNWLRLSEAMPYVAANLSRCISRRARESAAAHAYAQRPTLQNSKKRP